MNDASKRRHQSKRKDPAKAAGRHEEVLLEGGWGSTCEFARCQTGLSQLTDGPAGYVVLIYLGEVHCRIIQSIFSVGWSCGGSIPFVQGISLANALLTTFYNPHSPKPRLNKLFNDSTSKIRCSLHEITKFLCEGTSTCPDLGLGKIGKVGGVSKSKISDDK